MHASSCCLQAFGSGEWVDTAVGTSSMRTSFRTFRARAEEGLVVVRSGDGPGVVEGFELYFPLSSFSITRTKKNLLT